MDDPVLVASTDGVGTKVELAARARAGARRRHDIVNHCIDDVLVQAARPLFFLDYIAASRARRRHGGRDRHRHGRGVRSRRMRAARRRDGGDAGRVHAGRVRHRRHARRRGRARDLLPRDDVAAGDVLVGVASSGPHTNGYSLLRKLFDWLPMDVTPAGLDRPLGEALLEPHRSYLDVLPAALATGRVKALAHITGGGLPENVPRVLPDGVDAEIELGSWPVPPLFRLVRDAGRRRSTTDELHRMLNMGIGMVVVCAAGRRRRACGRRSTSRRG